MTKTLLLASLLLGSSAALADDPPPPAKVAQPMGLLQLGAVQPANPFGRVAPATVARYEEDADVLEAQLDVKKAYIKAADVGVMGAKVKLDRAMKLAVNKAITNEEVELAKLDLETATAQLEIRRAETKEVEVKLKYAKKRLEDAKALRPAPPARAADPIPVNPR